MSKSPIERIRIQEGSQTQATRPELPITRVLERLYTQPRHLSASLTSFAAEATYIIFMYRHMLFVLVTLACPNFHACNVHALAIAPQGSIITAINQTSSLSTLNLTLPQGLVNGTLAPLQQLVPYHVPHSPTTLLFHSFGPEIPTDELLRAVAFAVGIAFDNIAERRGKAPIAAGHFVYTHEFLNMNVVEISIADFREVGLPMNYFMLRDTLRGIGEFVLLRKRVAQEMSFEVEVENVGYLGTGHVEHKQAATPTTGVTSFGVRPAP